MKILPLCLLLGACETATDGKATDPMDAYVTLECTSLHSTFTGDELMDEVAYYEALSTEPAEVSLTFYHEVSDDTTTWWDGEVIVPTEAFVVVSSEVVEDGWTDIYGNPLSTVVFVLDLTLATTAEAEVVEFFDPDGAMELEAGEEVWLHIWSASDTGTNFESLNAWLTGAGSETDYGSCALR